jgi:hypothetical protein
MAELILRLRVDPATGRKTVVVQYETDSDALPIEHEQEHKALVDKLIAAGALAEADRGNIVIERLPEKPAGQSAQEEPQQATPITTKV